VAVLVWNATLCFGDGNALNAMDTGLKLEGFEGAMVPKGAIGAVEFDDAVIDGLNRKAFFFGKTSVHAEEITGKDFGFVTTGGAADFDE